MAGAHGVAGTVRIRSFTTEPSNVAAYGPVSDENGDRTFEIEVIGEARGTLLARIAGVDDRDAADALRGVRLYVAREVLPPPGEEEYYHGDLLGLAAELPDGAPLGTVTAIRLVGETDVLEIERGHGLAPVQVPFTRATAPLVDVAGGRIVVDPPPGLIEAADDSGDRG